MKRKTEDSYRRILTYTKNQLLTWEIQSITTDFEIGLVNSVRNIFPDARHQGCWFHYTQAIWRHVVVEGLTNVIHNNFDAKRVVKMLMTLPHLPPHQGPPHDDRVPPYGIVDGLNAINNYVDEGLLDHRLTRVIAYVRRYWVGVIGVESLSTFQAPRRTNNHLESFHTRMLAAFGVNLDVWSFIRKLREVERSSFDDLQRLDRDDPQRVRRARSDNNANSDAIRMALRRLTRQEITLINFLTTVSHCADNLLERGFIQQHNGLQEAVVVDEEIIEWMLPVAGEEVVVAAENVRPPARRRRRRQQGVLQRPIEAQQQPHAAPRLSNCVICLNNECTHIALPCGHICMCEECAEQNLLHMNGQPRCPLCNIHCTHYQRVYLNFQ
ncbi:uncharacterized protein LOC111044042 [Nilaparvata lugens]|uniref:uncharacterized protein LOC111044042 n=1 Tax=Nilaparvata lugens TaxID=108931 RepID=UPI00193D7FDA|nr:uncharacterized protein LOC111044042 [Nilaparvata lugens]